MRIVRSTVLGILVLWSVAPCLGAATDLPIGVLYVRVPAAAFFPAEGGAGYFSSSLGGPRYSGDDGIPLQAAIQLPSGARIVSLRMDFNDTDSAVSVLGSLLSCDALLQGCIQHPAAGAGPKDCLQDGFVCSGADFAAGAGSEGVDLSMDGLDVDNVKQSYSLVAITATNLGGIAGMLVGYVLQVSPPPPLASFDDVPTDHPFFKFIEALTASGITAGCDTNPPRFCPDQPLTRGQMAVFLAVGLGLQRQ